MSSWATDDGLRTRIGCAPSEHTTNEVVRNRRG